MKASKTREVVSAPAVLAIQLKRFYSVGGKGKRYQSGKITKGITYPDKLPCQQLGSVRYRLLAVGRHRGGASIHCGHCTATVRYGESWFECDDKVVSPTVSPVTKEPDGNECYLLYQKI